MVAVR
ncbi:hypothetical protein AYI69_g5403, partial [Smittium culicis]